MSLFKQILLKVKSFMCGFRNPGKAKDLEIRVEKCSLCKPNESLFCKKHKKDIDKIPRK